MDTMFQQERTRKADDEKRCSYLTPKTAEKKGRARTSPQRKHEMPPIKGAQWQKESSKYRSEMLDPETGCLLSEPVPGNIESLRTT